jgi:ElaB/YqjD/DUF883 family membrane-anchored ribosome-binding protein
MSIDSPAGEPSASDQLGEKLNDVKKSLHELGAVVAALAKEKVGEFRQRSQGECGPSAVEPIDDGCCAGAAIGQKVEEVIRRQPLIAVAVAAGAGALLGLLCCRR